MIEKSRKRADEFISKSFTEEQMMSVRIDLFSKSIVEELTEIFTIIIVMDNTRAMILMEGLSRIKEIFKN